MALAHLGALRIALQDRVAAADLLDAQPAQVLHERGGRQPSCAAMMAIYSHGSMVTAMIGAVYSHEHMLHRGRLIRQRDGWSGNKKGPAHSARPFMQRSEIT